MDYKIIIILLVLVLLIILVYREISLVKDDMSKNISILAAQSMQNSDKVINKIQGDLGKYISQMKVIGNDNLVQLRKITLLNQQPITGKFANHYTEMSAGDIETNIQHHENNNIFEKNEILNSNPGEFYMSEDGNNKNSEISEFAEKSPNSIHIISEEEEELPIYISKTDNSDSDSDFDGNIHDEEINKHFDENLLKLNKSGLDNSIIEDDGYNSNSDIPIFPLTCNNTKNKNEIEIDIYDVLSNQKNLLNNSLSKILLNNIEQEIIEEEIEDKVIEEVKPIEPIKKIKKVKEIKKIKEVKKIKKVKKVKEDKKVKIELKDIGEYTLGELKKLAKDVNIKVTDKDTNTGKIRVLKKEEIYYNIGKCLE
jgi:hypothetical protein